MAKHWDSFLSYFIAKCTISIVQATPSLVPIHYGAREHHPNQLSRVEKRHARQLHNVWCTWFMWPPIESLMSQR